MVEFIVRVAVPQGSKAYILRSILDPARIERAAPANKCIFEVKAAKPGARECGTLTSWDNLDQR